MPEKISPDFLGLLNSSYGNFTELTPAGRKTLEGGKFIAMLEAAKHKFTSETRGEIAELIGICKKLTKNNHPDLELNLINSGKICISIIESDPEFQK